jgi:catechol 2,3-dioxygenase-like lactoylglutathione lyase family enzyme
MPVPDGKEAARPFLPARDFEISRTFYEALGFRKLLDSEVAIFAIGATSFILQRFYQEGQNLMMQLMVDDLDGWWSHITSLDLPERFGVPEPKPPETMPWGLRIVHLVDPAGVLCHIAQRREGKPHD